MPAAIPIPLPTVCDPLYLDDVTAAFPNLAIKAGRKLNMLGQTVSTLAGAVANQPVGIVGLPALAAAATGTVTITNSLITATSLIFMSIARGTTTAAAGAVATVHVAARVPVAGSCVIDATNLGSAATLSTDYILWYWIVN